MRRTVIPTSIFIQDLHKRRCIHQQLQINIWTLSIFENKQNSVAYSLGTKCGKLYWVSRVFFRGWNSILFVQWKMYKNAKKLFMLNNSLAWTNSVINTLYNKYRIVKSFLIMKNPWNLNLKTLLFKHYSERKRFWCKFVCSIIKI